MEPRTPDEQREWLLRVIDSELVALDGIIEELEHLRSGGEPHTPRSREALAIAQARREERADAFIKVGWRFRLFGPDVLRDYLSRHPEELLRLIPSYNQLTDQTDWDAGVDDEG